MAREDYSEGHYARLELFETNRNHMPWINGWLMLSVVVYVLHLVTRAWGHPIWQLLVLAVWTTIPAMGLFIRAEALVRRHWGLWTKKNSEIGITPDQASKNYVLVGNIFGLLLPSVMFGLELYDASSELTIIQTSVMVVAFLVFAFGAYKTKQASEHKVQFT